MPNDPEHAASMFALARQREAEGKPKWAREVDLTDLVERREAGELSRVEYIRAVARRVKDSGWARDPDRGDDLDGLLEEMAGCEVNADAQYLYDWLYDLADVDRVWIDAHGPRLEKR